MSIAAEVASRAQGEARDAEIVKSWSVGLKRAGGLWFTLLEDHEVDFGVWVAAHAGLRLAKAHLGLALAPEMRFFREETRAESAYRERYCAEWPMFTGPDQRGHADREDGSIGVRAERHTTRAAAAETAAHEARHFAQPRELHREEAEEDAVAYGKWAAGLLVKGDRVARVHSCVLPPWSEIVRPDHGDIAVYRGPSSGIFKNVGVPFAPRWERTPPYLTGV